MSDTKQSKWQTIAAIVSGLLYLVMVVIAIFTNVKANAEYAFSVSSTLAMISSILLIVFLTALFWGVDLSYSKKQAIAFYVFLHLIIWGVLLFLPFGDHPVMSLAIVFLIGLAITANMVGSTEAEYKSSTASTMKASSGNFKGLAILLVGIALAMFLFTKTGLDTNIEKYYDKFMNEIRVNKKVENKRGNSDNEVKSSKMVAHINYYLSPLQFGVGAGSNVPANGTIDLSNLNDPIINLKIDIRGNGIVNINNGDVLDNGDGSYTINSMYEYNGYTGNCQLLVSEGQTRIALYHNGKEVSLINVFSN